ncbi:hypothetical protein AB0O67_15090 [Streptomyces sp. NPDC086077]|uniref:hypothetical protein n=1 Tax=Streptomyces sp. NPDC086077 TaxID=3154862 RepID=UPI00344946B3
MAGNNAPRDELGDFLKARRAQLRPHAVGMPNGDRPRRMPGLRREDVAQLAAISLTATPASKHGGLPASAPVLAALAPALRPDEDQRAYLYGLAGKDAARPRRRTAAPPTPTTSSWS